MKKHFLLLTHLKNSRLTRRSASAGCPLHERTPVCGAFSAVRGRQMHSHAHAWSLTHRQTLAPALTAGAETQTLGVHHTRTQSSADSVLTKMKLKKRLSKFNRNWVISLLTSNWL